MDFGAVLEEIALEGLDGITLNGLWLRLTDRSDLKIDTFDEDLKQYVFHNLSQTHDVNFYTLPEARPELTLWKYNDYVVQGMSKCIIPEEVEIPFDFYSLTAVDRNGEMGACDHYHTRVSVDDEVRSSDMTPMLTFEEATQRWGQQLVIVASQKQRWLILTGSSFNIHNLSQDFYTILEKIARSRYDGEVTQCIDRSRGLRMRTCFLSHGNLYMKIKKLKGLKLITKQDFTTERIGQRYSTRLHHLKKYYRVTEGNIKTQLVNISKYLLAKPHYTASYHNELLKDCSFVRAPIKKHIPFLKRILDFKLVPYRSYFTDATEKEWRSKNGSEKLVKIVTLIKPLNNIYDELKGEDSEEEDDYEDEDEDSSEEKDEEEAIDIADVTIKDDIEKEPLGSDYGYPSYHLTIQENITKAIEDAGPRGINIVQLTNRCGFIFAVTNRTVNLLVKQGKMTQLTRSYGRTSSLFYVSPKFCKLKDEENTQPISNPEDATTSTTTSKSAEVTTIDDDEDYKNKVEEKMEGKVKQEEEEMKLVDTVEMDRKLEEMKVIWNVDKCADIVPQDKTGYTPRKLDRKAFIHRCLQRRHVYPRLRYLMDDVHEYERKRKELMCRKSFTNLIKEMYTEGSLYYVKAFCKVEPYSFLQEIVVEGSVPEDDIRIKRALVYIQTDYLHRRFKSAFPDTLNSKSFPKNEAEETNDANNPSDEVQGTSGFKKNKVAASSKGKTDVPAGTSPKKVVPKPKVSRPKTADKKYQLNKDDLKSVLKILDESAINDDSIKLTANVKSEHRRNGVAFGLLPKFERLHLLHKYCFYLNYCYTGSFIDQGLKEEKPPLPLFYLDVQDWRRFLPPLVKHNRMVLPDKTGICMLGDLLIHIPVCVFCNIVNVHWEVPGLKEVLDDPVMCNFPLKCLPSHILRLLLYKRKYIPRVIECLQLLCQMGLLSFINQAKRESEYLTVYFHKKAMLLDTNNSLPGNIMTKKPPDYDFSEIHHNFTSLETVDKYWKDLRIMGTNAPLGHYSSEDLPGNNGEINLVECCKQKSVKDVKEDNWLPGDRRGAGGMDSSLFLHRPSNWISRKGRVSTQLNIGKDGKPVVPKVAPRKPAPSEARGPITLTETQNSLFESSAKNSKKGKKKKKKYREHTGFVGSSHRAKIIQKRMSVPYARRTRKSERKPYLDEKDKASKMLMGRVRSRFSPVENGMLLLCQVASWIMFPNFSKREVMCVNFNVVRDILQNILPQEASDKTRNSLKGRYGRLYKEDKFNATAIHFLSLAKIDEKLMSKYMNHGIHRTDPRVIELFTKLVHDLLAKFKSMKRLKFVELPSTLQELNKKFKVCYASDVLEKHIKLTADCNSLVDAHVFVVWEMILSMLHYQDGLPMALAYQMLKTFDDHVVTKALDLLQQARIITKLKRDTKGDRKYPRSGLPHYKKVTLRHKDALRTRAPIDLISKVRRQLEALCEARSNAEFISEPKGVQQSDVVCLPSDTSLENCTLQLDCEEMEPIENETPVVNSLDKDNERLNVNDGWTILDSEKYQAGSTLCLLSLLSGGKLKVAMDIPDEMIKLDDEVMKKLEVGQTRSRKRKKVEGVMGHWVMKESNRKVAEEIEDCQPSEKKGKLNTGQSHNVPTKSSFSKEDKYVQKSKSTTNIHVTYRCLKSPKMKFLNDYQVSLASGSLLTLARMGKIDDTDIRANKFLFSQNFTMESLDMKFMLDEECVDGLQILRDNCANDGQKTALNGERGFFGDQKSTCTNHLCSMPSDDQSSIIQSQSSSTKETDIALRDHLFNEIFKYMEATFSLEFLTSPPEKDIRLQLPLDLILRGCKLVRVLNTFGFRGAIDAEIELEMKESIVTLRPLLKHLMRIHCVFSVGMNLRRFVSRQHASHWMVACEMENIGPAGEITVQTHHFQSRMWRRLDGSINFRSASLVVHKLVAVLVRKSGMQLQALLDSLNPDMLPVTSLDLLEILEDLHSLDFSHFPKKKASLFTTPSIKSELGFVQCDDYVTSVCLSIHAPLVISQFLEVLRQHCDDAPEPTEKDYKGRPEQWGFAEGEGNDPNEEGNEPIGEEIELVDNEIEPIEEENEPIEEENEAIDEENENLDEENRPHEEEDGPTEEDMAHIDAHNDYVHRTHGEVDMEL